ncbi:MAG: hypothetical protein NTW19_22640, partial [Planctomycetota bacterium]|nr:hypothetical protein [Planctomycetota bacterium]
CTPDTAPPTASVTAANVSAAGATSYTFTVTYSDNIAVNTATLDGSDIRVTGPNGYSALASFVSVDVGAPGTPRTATYSITPPGGAWAFSGNGTYTVSLVAGQVADSSGNTAAAATLGTFTVATPSTVFSPVATYGDMNSYTAITPSRWSIVADANGPVLSINTSNYSNLTGNRLGELAVVGSQTYGNFDMSLIAASTEDFNTNSFADLAVVFGYVDANNYNYAWYNSSASSTIIASVVAGNRTTLATASAAGVTDNAYHALRVVRSGQTVTVSRDGSVLMTATNAALAAVGSVGVGSYNDAANFDDISVTVPAADTTAPTASLTAGNVSAAGGTSYSFTVTFSDNAGINVSTLDGSDVRVTGPNGFSQLAGFVGVDVNSNGTPRTATYSITPPSGTWAFSGNGSYSVALIAGQVADTSGNTAAAATLGSFTVSVPAPDTTAPTASLTAGNVSAAGGTSYIFTVTYTDSTAVSVSSLDGSDVRVTGPNGFSQLAGFVGVNINSDGATRTATYSITPPSGAWSYGANGTYSVAVVAGQVADTNGNTTAAATLGTFTVAAPDTAAPTASLTAGNVSAAGGTSYTFTVTFTDNAAVNVATLNSSDILVTGPNGFSQLASFVGVNVNSNGAVRTATYSITPPGGAWDNSGSGTYTISLVAGQVADTSGNTMSAAALGTFDASIPLTVFSSIAGYGSITDYTKLNNGRWAVVNDTNGAALTLNATSYSPLSGGRLGEYALASGTQGDFDLSVAAKTAENLTTNPSANYAVVFGYVDANNYSFVSFGASASNTVVAVVVNGQRTDIAAGTLPGINDNAWHNLRLVRSGTTVTAMVDGSRVAGTTDARLGLSGKLGLGAQDDAALFDDVNPVALAAAKLRVTRGNTKKSSGTVSGAALPDATPIDLGSAAATTASPTQTYVITNDGAKNLVVGNITLPTGYSIVKEPKLVLAAGESDTMVVALNTLRLGYASGSVAFTTNDPSQAIYSTGIQGVVSTPLFDEAFYLWRNPDVAADVARGVWKSGYAHFTLFGQRENRAPSRVFSEAFYLQKNPGVAAAVASGAYRSGFEHYVLYGQRENRSFSPLFDERTYLSLNPDVATAIGTGQWRSGAEHFVAFGLTEGRRFTALFSESTYLALNPDVAADVARGVWSSGYAHFIAFGRAEGREYSATFSEATYLRLNPDVAADVARGVWSSGLSHFLRFGQYEGRIAI